MRCYSQNATIITFVWEFPAKRLFGRRHRAISDLTLRNWTLSQCITRLNPFLNPGSFPPVYVPTLDNDIFAIINTQPIKMQMGEQWIMIANFRHEIKLADSLGCTVSSSSTTSIWCQHPYSLTQMYVVFIQYMQLFISSSFNRKPEVHGVNVLSFISNYM